MSHAEYCRQREQQERAAAEAATCRTAQVAHRRLATMFAERANAAERHARIKAAAALAAAEA